MKDFILTIILHDNMTVEFKDGINTLNAHQAARQFIYVEMSGFSLAEGETLHMAFEKGEELHLNPMHMKYSENTGSYGLRIPKEVRDNPGEWTFTLYVKSNWNEVTGTADNVWPSGKYMFYEHSAIADDGTIVPSESDVIIAWNETKKNAETALNSAERAEAAYDQLINVDLPNNYVTVDTNQTISGNKTHTGINTFNGFTSINGVGIDADAIVKGSDRFKYPVKSGTLALTSDIPENIVTTDENGQIKVPLAPAQDDDAVSKKYVDDADNTKLNKVEPFANGTYAYIVSKDDQFGTTNGYTEISETDKISTIAKRKTNGCIETRTPRGANEAANKGYVDTAISDTQGQLAQTNQNVEDLYTILEQAQVVTVTTLEQAYTTRETADGENIVDGVQTTVKEIRGKTVATTNQFAIENLNGGSGSAGGALSVSGAQITVTNYYACSTAKTFRQLVPNARAGTYTIFFNLSTNGEFSGSLASGAIAVVDSSGSKYLSSSSFTSGGSKSNIFTITEEWFDGMVYFYGIGQEGVTVSWSNLIIVEGDVTSNPPSYSDYFPGLKNAFFKEIVSTGKNLISYPYYSGTDTLAGITFTVKNDGTITANGTATNNSIFVFRKFDFLLPAGTYTVSGIENGSLENYCIQISRDNYTQSWNLTNGSTQIELKQPASILLQIVVFKGVTVNNLVFRPMLQFGTTATAYEPYISDTLSAETPIELAEFDVAYPETGEIQRQSNTVTFNGTESWYLTTQSEGYFLMALNINPHANKVVGDIISNRGENFAPAGAPNNDFGFYIANADFSALVIWFNKNFYPNVTDLSSAKSQLAAWAEAGDPLTVTYKTAETTTEATPFNKSKYIAWKNGSETIIQGDTDNSIYGAENTVKQDYFTLTGGTTNV